MRCKNCGKMIKPDHDGYIKDWIHLNNKYHCKEISGVCCGALAKPDFRKEKLKRILKNEIL